MHLKKETLLKRTNDIELRLDSHNSILVTVNNKSQRLTTNVLKILDAFAYPISIKDALNLLKPNGTEEWIELSSKIGLLYEMEALCKESEIEFLADKTTVGFGSAPAHIRMLNDQRRTGIFIKALNETVKEGDVVVDIGTGTGVLAIAAARAGAKKVYAIEAGAMADVAQEIINTTEVAKKIMVVRGWSTGVELPEKADVLVSEMIGDDPLAEKVLQVYIDARRRFLKANATILPGSIKIWALTTDISRALLKNRVLKSEDVENWKNLYGIDFSALKNVATNRSLPIFKLTTSQARELNFPAQPLLLSAIDFYTFEKLRVENLISAISEAPFNGVLVYFELAMGNDVLTTHPKIADKTNHWLNPVWCFPEIEKIKTGQNFTIRFISGGSNSEMRLITST